LRFAERVERATATVRLMCESGLFFTVRPLAWKNLEMLTKNREMSGKPKLFDAEDCISA